MTTRLLIAALAATAGLASAAPTPPAPPLLAVPGAPAPTIMALDTAVWATGQPGAPAGAGTTAAVQTETIEIHDIDGDVRVFLNGEVIPSDRLVRRHRPDGDVLAILTTDRNVLREVRVPGAQYRVRGAPPNAGGGPTWVGPAAEVADSEVASPRAILGVFLTDPSPEVRAVLGLGDKPVVMIDGVMAGLPAEKAGLRQYDIIIAADGRMNVSPDEFREIMAQKQAGQSIALTVLRQGRESQFTITLDAAQEPGMAPQPPQPPASPLDPGAQSWGDMGRELRNNAMAQITDALREAGVKLQGKTEAAIQGALKELEESLRARGGLPGGSFLPLLGVGPNGDETGGVLWMTPGSGFASGGGGAAMGALPGGGMGPSMLAEIQKRSADAMASADAMLAERRGELAEHMARLEHRWAEMESRWAEMEERFQSLLKRIERDQDGE